jgi:four helix bundle protein
MKYRRFEDLPVWNDAIDLAVRVYALTSKPEFRSHWSLKDQIERSAVSVSNNIAEGFERGTNKELLTFLYISRGSSGEVRSMTRLLERIPDFQLFVMEIRTIRTKAESCSKQLKGWIQSIQNSDFKGERHVNARTKRLQQTAREREEFLKELAEIRARDASANSRKNPLSSPE